MRDVNGMTEFSTQDGDYHLWENIISQKHEKEIKHHWKQIRPFSFGILSCASVLCGSSTIDIFLYLFVVLDVSPTTEREVN